jgi:DNA-binding NarL/FixJ family response regulator
MKETGGQLTNPAERKRLRVLLIDDHPLMRSGIKELLKTTPDLDVCGEVGKASEALGLLEKLKPDLVLLDLGLPDRSGLEVLKDFQAISPTLPVLVVSMYDEMLYAERTLRAGARGYVMKEAGGEKLLAAIRAALEGRVWVSDQVSSELLGNLGRRNNPGRELQLDRLSDREFEIFRMLGEGLSTRDIAERLNLSPKTVDAHRANIKTKLGMKDGAALVRQAVRWTEAQSSRNVAVQPEL